ncbi:hypothetical protein Nepgr_028251 [Nepenthes gracilis]|uniref:PWWP domain-containing protein n=1 Tax=Nepenthes gracilis TaxID=150966 RepID=A0AAD3TBZ9_NEPGR|nr:hypothetical protein Nepgr_028251 [Nepenthes gracilis]
MSFPVSNGFGVGENMCFDAIGGRFDERGLETQKSSVKVHGGRQRAVEESEVGGDVDGWVRFDGHGNEGDEKVPEKRASVLKYNFGADSSTVGGSMNRIASVSANSDLEAIENLRNESEFAIAKESKDDGFSRGVKAVGDNDLFPCTEQNLYQNVSRNQAVEAEMKTTMGNERAAGVNLVVDLNSCIIDLNSCIGMDEDFELEDQRGLSISDCTAVNAMVDKHEADIEAQGDRRTKNGEEFCFRDSDLVWGKVRSHPWWPGQIFQPWDASEIAEMHFRPNRYLVAYFGDQTFAWIEGIKLKQFWPHFSQMEKQSNSEAFQHSVNCALEEAHRRVEFSLSCCCVSEDVYNKIKTQIVLNAGIREQSSIRQGGDKFLTALSFEPMKLVDCVKALAKSPCVEVNRLELVTIHAQLSSFYRWKGHYFMAEFLVSDELLVNEVDASVFVEEGDIGEVIEDSLAHKTKLVSGDSYNRGRKERRLADVMKGLNPKTHKEDKGKPGRLTPFRGAVDVRPQDEKQYLEVEEGIRKVASQINSPSYVKTWKTKSFAWQSKRERTVPPLEYSSSDEKLSQLRLSARDPLRGYSFLSCMVSFFWGFRKSVVEDNQNSLMQAGLVEKASAGNSKKRSRLPTSEFIQMTASTKKSKKTGSKSGVSEKFKLEVAEDSYWTDRIISVPEEAAFLGKENEMEAFHGKENEIEAFPDPPTLDGKSSGHLDSEQETGSMNLTTETSGQNNYKSEEISPTALILNFSDSDSIPSASKLHRIFSCYGSLLESETEVLKKSKRVKVVFERYPDAETAFSSSGKFRTFGPSLISYRLNCSPILRKDPIHPLNAR